VSESDTVKEIYDQMRRVWYHDARGEHEAAAQENKKLTQLINERVILTRLPPWDGTTNGA
jgi:hypothetical protein